MCCVCFLATEMKLAPIPFDESSPAFCLTLAKERPTIFSAEKFVYECGASTFCACGFGPSDVPEAVWERTTRELQTTGTTSKETELLWWKRFECPPPSSASKAEEDAEEYRTSWRDRRALFDVLDRIVAAGFDCRLFICWEGDQNSVDVETFDLIWPQDGTKIRFQTTDDLPRIYRISRRN